LSADRRIAAASTDAVWRVGRRPVFDIHLASGRRLRATARHRLLGARGWVRVEALHRGDRLAVARCIPEPAQPVRWPDARLALLGHLIGDGSYVKHQPMHFQFAPSRAMLGEYAELLHDEALRSYTTDDVFWDRVVGVEPAGDEEVYDLTVPGSASWLADGIVSHNSGAIEQDADVVMFIYREEEHKPTDENRGMAELIIAKQRNGPTGSIKLAFFKEFTRFENLERQWQ
jgi:replicative DNA helicase